jgi:hypothetical protein
MFSPLEQFDVVLVKPFSFWGFDISFLNLHWPLLSLLILVLAFLFFFNNRFMLVPNF